jgi:GAF domain
MSDGRSFDDLAGDLAEMARELLEQETVQDTLDRIVARAVDLVEGCEAAGILVLRRHEVATLAGTDNVAKASDRIQGELGEGPCFDALERRERVYCIGDLGAAAGRWTKFVARAQALGIGSMMGFLLYTNGRDDLGALHLYSSHPGAFTERVIGAFVCADQHSPRNTARPVVPAGGAAGGAHLGRLVRCAVGRA